MIENQKHILFFDFLQNLRHGILNVVKKLFVLAEDNTGVKAF
jgi:septum formation topological specificity factor MinE